MKITSFNPMIVTKDADSVLRLFEDLGFEKQHTKTDIEGGENTSVRMKDAGGFHVDVVSAAKAPQDLLSIRINVDDFDEAYDFFMARGFTNITDPDGERTSETGSSRAVCLVSPSGFAITLIQHIKP